MRKQTRALRRAATSLADIFRKAGVVAPPATPKRAHRIITALPEGTVAEMQAGQPAYMCSIIKARGHRPVHYRVGTGNRGFFYGAKRQGRS